MFTEFMIELFYSRARRKKRRIAGYATVFATPLPDKMADQKTGNVTALGGCPRIGTVARGSHFESDFLII